jgi:hypothetical protein
VREDYDAETDDLGNLGPHEAYCYRLSDEEGQEKLGYLAVEELGHGQFLDGLELEHASEQGQ